MSDDIALDRARMSEARVSAAAAATAAAADATLRADLSDLDEAGESVVRPARCRRRKGNRPSTHQATPSAQQLLEPPQILRCILEQSLAMMGNVTPANPARPLDNVFTAPAQDSSQGSAIPARQPDRRGDWYDSSKG